MMKLLLRIWNFFFGWLNKGMGEVEAQAPEVVYQNTIDSIKSRHEVARKAAGAVKAREMKLKKRQKAIQDALKQDEIDLNAAVDESDDDLAKMLIDKKEQNQATLLEVEHDLAETTAEVRSAAETLNSVQAEIESLKNRKEVMISRLRNAEAKEQLRSALNGLSTSADSQALEELEDKINAAHAQTEFDKDAEEGSMEGRLKKLRQKSSSKDADAKLAALKAARAQTQKAAS